MSKIFIFLLSLVSLQVLGCQSPEQKELAEMKTRLAELQAKKDASGSKIDYTVEMRWRILKPTIEYREGNSDAKTLCQSYLSVLGVTTELVSTKQKSRYPDTLEAAVPDWLDEIPTCPDKNEPYRFQSSGSDGPPDFYKIRCEVHNLDRNTGTAP